MEEETRLEAETHTGPDAVHDSQSTPRSEEPSLSLSTSPIHPTNSNEGAQDEGYFTLQGAHGEASTSVSSFHAVTSPTDTSLPDLTPAASTHSATAQKSLNEYLEATERPGVQRDSSNVSTVSVESNSTVSGRDFGYSYASNEPPRGPAYPNQAFSALQQQRYPAPHLPPTLRTKTFHPAQPQTFRQAIASLQHNTSRSAGNSPSVTPGLFNPSAPPVVDHSNLGPDEHGFYASPFLHYTHRQAPKETHIADVDIDPISGRKIINNYEIIDELGRGTHGKVKLGRNLDTHEYVAIKIVERYSKKRRLGKLGNAEDKVKKEVAILKKARHPNIVALLEVIDDPARKKVYIVLERVELGEIVWRASAPKEVALIENRRYDRESRGIFDDEEAEAEDRAILDEARARRLKQQRRQIRKSRRQRLASGLSPEAWSFEFGGDTDDEESDLERASRVSTTTDDQSNERVSRAPTPIAQVESEPTDLMTPVKTATQALEIPPDMQLADPISVEDSLFGSYDGADIMRAPSLASSVQSFGARGLSHHGAKAQYASAAISILEDEIHPELLHVPCMTMQAARVAFRDTVLGLQYLHWQGIIHRDIKPPNLLQTYEHRTKISDFGVSYLGRPINDDQAEDLSESDALDFDEAKELAKTVGTAAFYAPELCYTDMPLDGDTIPSVGKAIDVWALGVTLFCMLFGRTPFVDSEYVVMRRIADEDIYVPNKRLKPVDPRPKSRPSSHGRHFPPTASGRRSEYELIYEELDDDLLDLLRRLLIKDPEHRITLEEVRHHPWVLQDIANKDLWLNETDPSRQAQGKKIQVSKEELQDAVVPVKLVERIRSGLKKTVGGLMSGLGRASSASSRPRAPSHSSGSNIHSAASSSSTISQDARRSSLRGDEQIFSALQASREREHPLAQSVTISPVATPGADVTSATVGAPSRKDVTSAPSERVCPSPPEDAKAYVSTSGSIRTIRPTDAFSPPKIDSPPSSPSLISLNETSAVSNIGGLLSGAGRRILKTVRDRSAAGRSDASERSASRGPIDCVDPHGGPSVAINNTQAAGHMDLPEALKDMPGSAPVSTAASAMASPVQSRSHSVAGHRDDIGLLHKGSSASLAARIRMNPDSSTHKGMSRSPRTIANESTEEGFRRAEDEYMRRLVLETREKSPPLSTVRPMSPNTCPPSPDDETDFRMGFTALRSEAASSAYSMETSPTSCNSSILPIMTPSSSEDRFNPVMATNFPNFPNPSVPSVTGPDLDRGNCHSRPKIVVGERLTSNDARKLHPFSGFEDAGYAADHAVDSEEDGDYYDDDSSDDDEGLTMGRRRSIPQRRSFGASSLLSHRQRRETGSSAFSKKSSRSGSNNTMKKVYSNEDGGLNDGYA